MTLGVFSESQEQDMAKNFKNLRDKMSPALRERARELAKKYRAEMALDELREARDMTQQHLAKILGEIHGTVTHAENLRQMLLRHEDSRRESGCGVEDGAPHVHVHQHTSGLCPRHGRTTGNHAEN